MLKGSKKFTIALFCTLLTLMLFTDIVSADGLDPTPLAEWFGGRVTSTFHDPERPYHSGVDFGVGWGTPIPSTWEGTVAFAGPYGDFGNMVIVQNGDWQMRYGHLSSFCTSVGQPVQIGDVVGLSGNTGVSTGAHLHYEVRYQDVALDPMTAPGVARGYEGPRGDFIELRARLNPTSLHSPQGLWTVVQWQHPDGTWRDVEGWRGNFDEIAAEGGKRIGKKTWWVDAADLGHGPFRWVVHTDATSERMLAASAPFALPSDGRAAIIPLWVP